jgi:hypothetical protein
MEADANKSLSSDAQFLIDMVYRIGGQTVVAGQRHLKIYCTENMLRVIEKMVKRFGAQLLVEVFVDNDSKDGA